jgi:uncharacterized protein YxeA
MSEEKENRIMAIGSIVMLLILVATCTGCTSKKKIISKENNSLEITENIGKKSGKNFQAQDTLQKKDTVYASEGSDLLEIQLTQADPEKTIVLVDPSGQITTITGAHASIKNEKKQTSIASGSEVASKNQVDIQENLEEFSTNEVRVDISTSKKEVEKTGTTPWIAFFVGLVLLLLVLAEYLRRVYFKK